MSATSGFTATIERAGTQGSATGPDGGRATRRKLFHKAGFPGWNIKAGAAVPTGLPCTGRRGVVLSEEFLVFAVWH